MFTSRIFRLALENNLRQGDDYMTRFAGMKFPSVQPGHISPNDYMGESNFIPERRDSFSPVFFQICIHFILVSFSFF